MTKKILTSLIILGLASPAVAATTIVSFGQTADNSVVQGTQGSPETQIVRGTTNSAEINSYGQQVVDSGGVANGSVISGTQSVQGVLDGGTANDTQILATGVQQVDGKLGGNTTIGTGGRQILANRFSFLNGSSKITIDGGTQYVGYLNVGQNWNETQNLSADYASRLVFNSGAQYVYNGSTINGNATNHLTIGDGTGEAKQYIYENSSVTNAVVKNNGTQNIVQGTATGTIVETGGVQVVSSYGTASGTVIDGGEQGVFGTLSGNITLNSGRQFLLSAALDA
ncbi:MAG: AIDA repeat-containing protein, partial [Rickettsiales bacterium]|nr:AIDA repeat-containing protein [Rickettsiales bacterium]